MKIERNDKMVSMIAASAMGRGTAEANKEIRDFTKTLMANPSPENRYHMAQLIQFAVDDGITERTAYFDKIADYKQIGDNDRAAFDVEYDTSYAVIQADNASAPIWMPASKTVDVGTVEVATRFRVSMYDIRSGKADLGKETAKAIARLEDEMTGVILNVLDGAYNGTDIAAPFYGTGSGVVATTLDPMVRHWQRYGATNLIGDIQILDKLAQSNGWVSDEMRNEYYNNGFLGKYKGANAYVMANGYQKDGVTPIMPASKLFILPNGMESPLKIVKRGEVLTVEETHADTAYFEMSLRQRFGAAIVYGNKPLMGVYVDSAA